MPKHLKKLSEEVLHQNPWWTYKHDTYEKPNGETGDYYYAVLPGNSIIIPVLSDGRLILTLQYRYITEKMSIEFPCGGRHDTEATALDTAKAELLEETGFTAHEFIHIGTFQALNGVVDDESHVFLAHIQEQGAPQPDDTEEIEILYRKPEEVDEMIQSNEIWDGQTMAAWAMAHHHFLHKEKMVDES